jgi:hypothetical protein
MNDTDIDILANMLAGRDNKLRRPPVHALNLLEDVCKRTSLDWKTRQVYLIERGGRWQVNLSIDGFRSLAATDPQYAGQEGPFWVTAPDGAWTDIPPEGNVYASKVGVKRRDGTITWGVAKFKDYAAGAMWSKFPSTMIAKCAEMLALRKACPYLFSGLYGTEEMDQASGKRGAEPNKGGVQEILQENRPIDGPNESAESYSAAITAATSLDGLKSIGVAIQNSEVPIATKMELSRLFQSKKFELSA